MAGKGTEGDKGMMDGVGPCPPKGEVVTKSPITMGCVPESERGSKELRESAQAGIIHWRSTGFLLVHASTSRRPSMNIAPCTGSQHWHPFPLPVAPRVGANLEWGCAYLLPYLT